jgi:hypothetical protein
MTRDEFKSIAEYVRHVGLALKEFDLCGYSAQLELPPLQRTIKRLNAVATRAQNSQVKRQVEDVEYTARRCTEIILKRNGMEN